MRKGFLIYEEMRKYLVMYEEAVSYIILCNAPFWISLYVRKILFPFLSVCPPPPLHTWLKDVFVRAVEMGDFFAEVQEVPYLLRSSSTWALEYPGPSWGVEQLFIWREELNIQIKQHVWTIETKYLCKRHQKMWSITQGPYLWSHFATKV